MVSAATKPRLLLHIGTWKTGSTAIQDFLQTHQSQLERQGIYYPLFDIGNERRRNHGKLDAAIGAANASGQNEYLREFSTMLAALIDDKKPSIVILSAESFWPRSPDYVERLLAFLAPFFAETDVIIYLRSQVELWISMYSQQSKILQVLPSHSVWGSREFVGIDVADHGMFYDQVLAAYADHLGLEHVHPRIYDRKFFKNGDIINDFLSFCGDPVVESRAVRKQEINPSWSWKGIEYSKLAASSLSAGRFPRKSLITAVQRTVAHMEKQGYDSWRRELANYLTPEQQNEIHEYYADSNKELSRRYFDGNDLFRRDVLPHNAGSLYDFPPDELKIALERTLSILDELSLLL
jgi:hypothetical protein